MPETEEISDKQFFQLVSEEPSLTNVLVGEEWAPIHVYGPIHGRNAGIKVWKHVWRLSHMWPGSETIEVHFEARRRCRIQVDVEIYPYEGSIDKDPSRVRALQERLELKTRLLIAIREEVMRDTVLRARLGATTTRLREPEAVPTLCAVQFDSKRDISESSSAAAQFYASVILAVSPIIDRTISPPPPTLESETDAPQPKCERLRRPLDAGVQESLLALRNGFTVSLIATIGERLQTCSKHESRWLYDEDLAQFDYIPIKSNGGISSVYERTKADERCTG